MPFLAFIPAILAASAEAAADVIAAAAIEIGVGTATAFEIGADVVEMGEILALNAAANALRGSTGGIQQRVTVDPLVTRRLAVGKVWTAGSAGTDPPITYSGSNKLAFKVIALADHECDGFEQIYIDDYPASLGTYDLLKGWPVLYTTDPLSIDPITHTYKIIKDFRVGQPKFYVNFHSGADGQAADAFMVSELTSLGLWDSTAVGQNVCYLVAYCYYDSELFSDFPTFNVYLRGAKLYDPTQDFTVGGSGTQRWGVPSTYTWSGNWAVIAYNIARGIYVGGNEFYGAFYGAEDLPLDNWFAAINACDEAVPLKAGGTEPRYHGGYELEVTKFARDALKICAEATAGEVSNPGQLLFFPGVAQTPVFTFSDSDMVKGGEQSFDAYGAMDELKNIVEAKYLDITQQFAMVDAPPRYSSADIIADAGIPLRDTLNLDQIQSGPTCQRIMEVMRKRSRAQATATRTFLATALNAQAGQWIAGTSSDWSGTKWFSIKRAKLNKDCTVTFTLREVPSDLEDWTPSTDELDSYDISLASGGPPDPLLATGISPIALSAEGGDGSFSPGLTVTYNPVDDPSTDDVVLQIAQVIVNSTTGYSNSTTTFQDPTATPFLASMVGKTIVIAGAGPSGAQYSDTIAGYTSHSLITLTDPTSVTASNLPYQILGASQFVTAADASDGIITASNLLGQTLYAYRVLISGLPGRTADWSDWSVITTSATQISGTNLIDGTLVASKFASTITPVELETSLPSTGNFEGRIAFCTDGQLYRFHAGGWTNAVPAVAITGQLTASQIASITAAQLTGQITTTQITPGSITTPLLGSAAVQTANLAAGSVVTASLASGSVTTAVLAAGSVTTSILAVGAVTATSLAANAVVAGTIAVGAINASALILNGVVITAHMVANAVTQITSLGPYSWTPSFGPSTETNILTGIFGDLPYLNMPIIPSGSTVEVQINGYTTRNSGRDPVVTITIYNGVFGGLCNQIGQIKFGGGSDNTNMHFTCNATDSGGLYYSATIETDSGSSPSLAGITVNLFRAIVYKK